MARFSSSAAAGYFKPEFMHTIVSKTLSRLRIPPKFFAENMAGGHQDNNVTMISDQLACPWEVTLEGRTLKDGWPVFVRALRLKVSDCLVFTYRGNYVFEVTAFGANGEKLEHEYWEQDECAIDGGNSSSGKGKRKQVEKEHVQSSGRQRNAAHGVENFAENSSRVKGEAGVVIKDDGNLSARRKSIRIDKNTSPVEKDCFIQIVTKANVDNNSVYFPTKFATENNLVARNTNILALVNINKESWGGKIRQCTDKRLKICGGWKDFCETNNLRVGDCCKFRIRSDTEHIVLDLVDVTNNGKKPDAVTIPSTPVVPCKEEECEFGEEECPANDVDVEMINMEAFYKFSAKNPKTYKDGRIFTCSEGSVS